MTVERPVAGLSTIETDFVESAVVTRGKPSRRDRALALIALLVLLALWEWASRAGVLSALFFPPPSLTARRLLDGIADGTLLAHTAATVARLLIGFALGALPGTVLGIALGWSAPLRKLIDPLIAAVHPLPKVAMLPLIILIFGINETSRFVVIALSVFFPMVINAAAGVRAIPPDLFELAHTYNAGRYDLLRRLILPASVPFLLAGVRLALNLALTMSLTVEIVFASQGLGTVVWSAWQTMRTESLYAALVLTAALGILINALLNTLMRILTPWHGEQMSRRT